MDLFLDFIQIFRRIMIILAQNKVGVKTCDFTLYLELIIMVTQSCILWLLKFIIVLPQNLCNIVLQ